MVYVDETGKTIKERIKEHSYRDKKICSHKEPNEGQKLAERQGRGWGLRVWVGTWTHRHKSRFYEENNPTLT